MTARKIKEKGWFIDMTLCLPDTQKVRIRRRSPVQTKRGAEAYERQVREQLLHASVKKQRKEVPTLRKFSKEFVKTYARINNKPSEVSSKETILRLHLMPKLGNLKLDAIGVRHVENLKAGLLAKGLKPKTVNNILAVLSRVITHAIEVEVLENKPKIRLLKTVPVKMDFLDFDEYERLLSVLHSEPLWGSAILAAGEAGLRLGEILGLYQEDIDFSSSVITVRRAVWQGIQGSPKGGRDRKVPMTQQLAIALQKNRHLKGELVWCDSKGELLTKKMAQRALQRACKRAGLRMVGWHCLRHTFCSHLAMLGAAPRAIQELAGHQHITTTMKYMHLAPTALYEAVGLLDARKAGSNVQGQGNYRATKNAGSRK